VKEAKTSGGAVLERPEPTGVTEDKMADVGFWDFPPRVYLIAKGGGKYAAMNSTTPPPDSMNVNGIIACETDEECQVIASLFPAAMGEPELHTFGEAHDIARGKPDIQALLLMRQGRCVDVHWVR